MVKVPLIAKYGRDLANVGIATRPVCGDEKPRNAMLDGIPISVPIGHNLWYTASHCLNYRKAEAFFNAVSRRRKDICPSHQ